MTPQEKTEVLSTLNRLKDSVTSGIALVESDALRDVQMNHATFGKRFRVGDFIVVDTHPFSHADPEVQP